MDKVAKFKAKADALRMAGDALEKEFPARSRELLRECRHYHLMAKHEQKKEPKA